MIIDKKVIFKIWKQTKFKMYEEKYKVIFIIKDRCKIIYLVNKKM